MIKQKIIATFLFCIISFFTIAQTTNIPDVNFEQQLVDLGIDSNGLNGNILNSDAQATTNLVITSTSITDFTGLEAFVNLISLNLGQNQFATVPLNTLTVLEDLSFDKNDALSSLDLSQNTALKTLVMKTNISVIGEAPITTLDLSQNINLQTFEIRHFKNITSLTFPITTTLTQVIVYNLATPTLDFSQLNGLEDLKINGSQVPVNIILPNESSVLKKVSFSSITLPTVDVSNYIVLESLSLHSTYVENLLLPSTNTFTKLTIWHHNFINPLVLSSVPNLTYLDIRFNQTVPLVIDITSNPTIKTLWLTHNDLLSVDLSNNTLLKTLYIYDNNLTNLDLTQNVVLERLDASSNQLPTVNLTQNIQLKYVTLSNNLITTLDVSNNVLLNSLLIHHNLLSGTGIDLSNNPILRYFDASYNQISSLNILQNPKLLFLIIEHNLFTGNDILNQYYQTRLADGGVIAGAVKVGFNQLSGTIPDFTQLVRTGALGSYDWTRRFEFTINDNRFEFGDFENQHLNYVGYLLPITGHSRLFSTYAYAPQAKVDTMDNLNVNAGTTVTLTTTVSGAQNHYKWFKNGVEIIGAADSPQYIITNVSSCDAAVYHSEITSDLVPFENSNPPGTNHKNLLLVRNDITLTINVTETCIALTSPLNGSTNVPINSVITWAGNPSSCGYFISVGTTSGGTDIINNLDVGDVTSYTFPSNLPNNTQIFVTITPYFQSGNTLSCNEETFTTGNTTITLPTCTNISNPIDTATNISINETITWNTIASATGYFISIGTSSGGTDIVNMFDVGNTSSYTHAANFLENTIYFVTVIPYNTAGNATACSEISFTTETIITIPTCSTISNPTNSATNISINETITWNTIASATGYFISIGTSSGGIDIVNMFDVGNTSSYTHAANFLENTTYFVTVIPYNTAGNATACSEISFTTETIITIPTCATISNPTNSAANVSINEIITWNTIASATGYFISIGTSSGGTDIVNMFDVGNTSSYSHAANFLENTTYFVTVIPYNTAGNATACSEISFTTETIITIPTCATISNPTNSAANVSINETITWNTITSATGYFISIGTSSGGTDIVNNLDVGNSFSYTPTTSLLENTTYYVTVIPYNTTGNAIACGESNFTTEALIPLSIPKFFSPNGDGRNDTWEIVDENSLIKAIYIYNRFGKLVHVMQTTNMTWNGVSYPSSDYWYRIELTNGKSLKGHFTLTL